MKWLFHVCFIVVLFSLSQAHAAKCDVGAMRDLSVSASRALVGSRFKYDAALYVTKNIHLKRAEPIHLRSAQIDSVHSFYSYMGQGIRDFIEPLSDSGVIVTVIQRKEAHPTTDTLGVVVRVESTDDTDLDRRTPMSEDEIIRQVSFHTWEIQRLNCNYTPVSLESPVRVSGKENYSGRFKIRARRPQNLDGVIRDGYVEYWVDVKPWKRQMIQLIELRPVS